MNLILKLLIVLLCVTSFSCELKNTTSKNITQNKPTLSKEDREKQEVIFIEHLQNGAWKHPLYSQEWQEEMDSLLGEKDRIETIIRTYPSNAYDQNVIIARELYLSLLRPVDIEITQHQLLKPE
jgi:hypothetical protein